MRSNNQVISKQDKGIFEVQGVKVYYSDFMALQEVNVAIPEKKSSLLLDLQVVEKAHYYAASTG